MNQKTLIALLAVLVVTAGIVFAAFDFGWVGKGSQQNPAATSNPFQPAPVVPSPGSTSAPVQTTGGGTGQTIEVYGVAVQDGVSFAAASTTVQNLGGEVLSVLPYVRMLVVRITGDQAALLAKSPDVLWVEKETPVQSFSFTAFSSISSLFFETAYADSPVSVCLVDSGDHANSVLAAYNDQCQLIGSKCTYNSQISIFSNLDSNGLFTQAGTANGIEQALSSGCSVINVSSGPCGPSDIPDACSDGTVSPSMQKALADAVKANATVVVAQGNTPGYVNGYGKVAGVISAGGLDQNGNVDQAHSTGATFYASLQCSDGKTGTSCSAPRMAAEALAVRSQPVTNYNGKNYDTNGNGVWDDNEVQAALADSAAQPDSTFKNGTASAGTAGGQAGGGTQGGGNGNGQPANIVQLPAAGQTLTPPIINVQGTAQGGGGAGAVGVGTTQPSPQALTTRLVPDKGANPASYNLCTLLTVGQNIINFGAALSALVATLMFAYGGVLYMAGSSGGEAQIKKAHKVLLNAVVGLLIVLLAWLIVNIVVSTLTGKTINEQTNTVCTGA